MAQSFHVLPVNALFTGRPGTDHYGKLYKKHTPYGAILLGVENGFGNPEVELSEKLDYIKIPPTESVRQVKLQMVHI